MYQVKVLEDYTRGKTPETVSGLEDWNQRKVLFNFDQNIESDTWTIQHNLKAYPEVFVFVNQPIEGNPDNQTALEPDDTFTVNENTIVLKFSRPWSGTAQLVVNTSFPGNRIFGAGTSSETQVQLTNSGEITIATLRPDVHVPIIDITARWIFAAGEILDAVFHADDVQSIYSPWRSFTMVEIGGKTYELRSFNVRNFNVPAGSHLQLLTYNANPAAADTFLIMVSKPPFEIFDVDKTRVVDTYSIRNDALAIGYDGFELTISSKKIKNIFPLIIGL
jgi:hypothetical protein